MAKKTKKKDIKPEEPVTNCDRFETMKHVPSPPYAFTEQGISMLSAVVTSQKAVDTSIRIMDAFVGMCAVTKMQVSPETVLQLL